MVYMNEYRNDDDLTEEELVRGAKRHASQTMWIKEAQDIPLEYLEKDELVLINKILNKQPLTDLELDQADKIIGKYRGAIHDIKPQETLKNVEDNIQYVNDEKALLELLDNQYEVKQLTFNYPLQNGRIARIELDVKPLTDSSALTDLVQDLKLFEDTTEEEQELYSKIRTGETLTAEEEQVKQQVQDKINDKIQQETLQNQMDMCRKFLAKQTTLHGRDTPYEVMLEIYEKMQLVYMTQLFSKVMDMINIGSEDIDLLFQENY